MKPPLMQTNLLLISLLHSSFIEKKYFHGNMGTYKIGGSSPCITPLGSFFSWGRSLKIQIEIKRELFMWCLNSLLHPLTLFRFIVIRVWGLQM